MQDYVNGSVPASSAPRRLCRGEPELVIIFIIFARITTDTMDNKAIATCRHCGAKKELTTVPLVNAGADPELKAAVKDGSLFVWECPQCGSRNLATFPLLYHDPSKKLMIWLLPEGDPGEKKLDAVASQLSGLEGYTLRRVSDPGALIEKVNIFDAGLDDVAMELCKQVTLMEMDRKPDGAIRFFRLEGADNEIMLSFPSGGNMMTMNIGFNVYEDCLGILRRNPAIIPGKGFARVDADWIRAFIAL